MNTQLAFAFGMLAMVAITMLVVIVVGMVKVIKLGKQVDNLQRELENTTTDTHRRIDEEIHSVRHEIEVIHRRFDDVYSIVDKRMNDMHSETHRRIDDEVRSIVDEIHNGRRHVDSRFDKFENKIMTKVEPDMAAIDLVIEKTKGKKQLLKD
jgi:biopolymer transport protein ExbB/TolQ